MAAGGVDDSADFGHGAARGILAGPAGHFFGDEIKEGDIAGDVGGNDGVADAIESDLGAFLFDEQDVFHGFAFDGIAKGAKKAAGLDLAFDEIVLGAFVQGLAGEQLVVLSLIHI